MIRIETFFGGSHFQVLPAPGPLYLSLQQARLWRLRSSSSSLAVRLPDFTSSAWVWQTGVPHFLLWNDSPAANSFDVCTFGGTVLYTVPQGEAVEVNLVNTSSNPNAGSASWAWDCRKRLRMT